MGDFTGLALNDLIDKGVVKLIPDIPQTFKENYILGTSKMVEGSGRSSIGNASELSTRKEFFKKSKISGRNRVKTMGKFEKKDVKHLEEVK